LGTALFPKVESIPGVERKIITFTTTQIIDPLPRKNEEAQLKAFETTMSIQIESASLNGKGTRVLVKNILAGEPAIV
jgi:hypothetical protein